MSLANKQQMSRAPSLPRVANTILKPGQVNQVVRGIMSDRPADGACSLQAAASTPDCCPRNCSAESSSHGACVCTRPCLLLLSWECCMFKQAKWLPTHPKQLRTHALHCFYDSTEMVLHQSAHLLTQACLKGSSALATKCPALRVFLCQILFHHCSFFLLL
jgi:hypothetical protein